MTFATLPDVQRRVGRPTTDAENDLITDWLEDALRYLYRGFARRGLDLDAQVTADDPDADTVIAVQAQAVADRIRPFDPEGLTSVTKAIDDGSITKRREGVTASTKWLTDDQWSELLPLATPPTEGAFSTRPRFQPDCGPFGSWPR